MSIIWICDICNSETRHLSDIGIKPENQILCRSCYEKTLEDVDCIAQRTLCQNMKCKKCYWRSFASSEKVFSLNFFAMRVLELKRPRYILKKSQAKYPFICDFKHEWTIRLGGLAGGRWCPDLQCKNLKSKQTCMRKYGVEYIWQVEEVKKKSRHTCMEKYGVENPMKVEKFKREARENGRQTCIEKYGMENPMQIDEIKERMYQTCLKKYGVKNPNQSEVVKEKSRQTCLEKYGVKYSSQFGETRKKFKMTCIEKYGVENPMKFEEIKKKGRQTCIKKYGVEYPAQSKEIKEKVKQTCIEKYGVESPMKLDEIRARGRQTCMKRYGVEHPSQCPEIFLKIQKSAFSRKEYLFPSGRATRVQGYEHIALNSLLQNYKENDIQTSFENRLKIDYYIKNKKHVYYPDIFIISENLIIEVKSAYTYNVCKDINELKAQACIDSGYKYEFYVIDKSGRIDIQSR